MRTSQLAVFLGILTGTMPAWAQVTDAGAPESAQPVTPPPQATPAAQVEAPPVTAPQPEPPAAQPAPIAPPPPAVTTPPDDAPTQFIDRRLSKSWELGGNRPFFSTLVDVGYLYLRPRAQLGYGKPFHKWIGIEANPSVTLNAVGGYAGIRLDLPHFDIRFGARHNFSFQRSYLLPNVSYDRYDLESSVLKRSSATTAETEANFSIPAGPGTVLGLASLSYVTGVPKGDYVYEETLRVVVQPPWVVRGRLGYVFGFGEHKQASIGPAVDVLDVPVRKSHVIRVGILARFVLSRSFEIRGSFLPRVNSQDDLGLLESDFTELGLRYRWATAAD